MYCYNKWTRQGTCDNINTALRQEVRQKNSPTPEPCGAMAARYVEMLTPEGVADALAATRDTMTWVDAAQARPDLEFFYQQLLERQPGLVGGKLPDAAFYG